MLEETIISRRARILKATISCRRAKAYKVTNMVRRNEDPNKLLGGTGMLGFDFEGSGVCWWCGGPLPKRRRHWCCNAHLDEYDRHFIWPYARAWCLERYDHRCANCGRRYSYHYQYIYTKNRKFRYEDTEPHAPSSPYIIINVLQAHHIIHVNGEYNYKDANALNLPDNLICLCTECHGLVREAENFSLQEELMKVRKAVARGKLLHPNQIKLI